MDTAKIVSRKDAIAAGLKHYYTGKPCKRGHAVERTVGSRRCVECDRKWGREKYANDPGWAERKRERMREWYDNLTPLERARFNTRRSMRQRANNANRLREDLDHGRI
jgi:hypothetical protein